MNNSLILRQWGVLLDEVKALISKKLFLTALENNKAVRAQDKELLATWLALPERTISAEQVIEVTGAKRASLLINNLGKRIATFLNIEPEAGNGAALIADEQSSGDDSVWVMNQELAAALSNTDEAEAPKAPASAPKTATPVAKPETVSAQADVNGPAQARLVEFEEQTIRPVYPDTPVQNRLLSPEMINALASRLPASKRAYQRLIPAELRKKVNSQESNRFLQQVLGLLKPSDA